MDNQIQLQHRVKQLAILHEIARSVTSILDLQSVLNRIVDAAVYLTNAEEGFLALVDEESQELHLRAGKGLGDKAAKVMRVSVSDSLSGQVIRTGKPLRMGGERANESYKVKTGYLVKSILKVPIKMRETILGVLSVDHAIESFKTFSDQDIRILTLLSDYAAVAIENARRYQEATARADTLSQALEEAGGKPEYPTQEADREALSQFNDGLRAQQQAIANARQEIRTLANDLYTQADVAADLAEQLTQWHTQADNLLPHLDWIAQTALARKATGQLADTADQTETVSIIDILLDNLPTGILLCDRYGVVVQAGSAMAQMFNRSTDELIGQTLQDLFPDDAHWEHLVGSLRLALSLGDKKTPPPPKSTTSLYWRDKVIQATLYPINKYRNQGIAIIAMFQDISVEIEGQRGRNDMVIALSESLRTPLSAVNSYGDLLLNESVGLITTAQRRYLQRIRAGVDQMEQILGRFINLLKDDLVKMQAEQVNLRSAFDDAMDAVREDLTLAGISLQIKVDKVWPPVQILPQFFTRIMTDLLIKAGAHIQPGGTLTLTTSIQKSEAQPDYLVIGLANDSINSQDERGVKDDPDLKMIAKAVEYQQGRVWVEIDYQGKWMISFLLPLVSSVKDVV